jgi:serine/threonine-protein kinase SRPK3
MVSTFALFTGVLFTCLATGNWKGTAEDPKGNLKGAEKQLEGDEKVQFLNFVKKMLKWKPEDRSSARELLDDLWLNGV